MSKEKMDQNSGRVLRLARWLCERSAASDEMKTITGDLDELYRDHLHESGAFRARLWYWGQVLPACLVFLFHSLRWKVIMLGSYFKIASRHLRRHKLYTLINIAGLAVGLACCMLIFLWVHHELSYDRFHEHVDDIYRITYAEEIGKIPASTALCPFAAPPVFAEEVPEIIQFCRLVNTSGLLSYQDRKFDETELYFTDPGFLEIFSVDFIAGDSKTALDVPGAIVISEEAARKIFGNENALGKGLQLNRKQALMVTGVVRRFPSNSHFQFDYLISYNTQSKEQREREERWLSIMGWAYVRLIEGADAAAVEDKMAAVVEAHAGKEFRESGIGYDFDLQPVVDIHLRSRLVGEIAPVGSMVTVYVFSIIGLFILVIASINFMNLSTAQSAARSREVGMRKVFGAERRRLIFQFISESLWLSILSFAAALVLVAGSLRPFDGLTGKSFTLDYLFKAPILIGIAVLVFLTGFLAGSYPAFFLSRFQPAEVIRSNLGRGARRSLLRSTLVVIQFTISVALIIGTLIILSQIRYMRHKDLGFDKEQALVINIPGSGIRRQLEAFKQEVLKNPNVLNAAYSSGVPGRVGVELLVAQEGQPLEESLSFAIISADYDFLDTFSIPVIRGRNFSKEYVADKEGAFILNESAAARIRGEGPVVGKKIGFEPDEMLPIIGIGRDFHFQSLREKIRPLAIVFGTAFLRNLTLKVNPGSISEVIDYVKEIWPRFEADRSFSYFFVDDRFERLYRSEKRESRIVGFFAVLAIFIASLGLYGLASYTAEQRTREIGIRKILGATRSRIVGRLNRNFLQWVILANAIAWPVSYYVMKTYWLENFSYRTTIGIEPFLMAGGGALLIALLTVSWKSVRAASANPADSLRGE